MLFEMKVEEMTKKCGNSYTLANLLGARAKQIAQNPPQEVIEEKKIPIQIAAEEILKGEVVASFPTKQ